MSVFHNNALIGAGGGAAAAAGFQIDRSLRFNSADSAYLNRTPSSAGNRKTYTLSFWVKKSKIDDEMFIFAAKHSGGRDGFRFEPGNTFRVFFDSANGGDLVTSQVFRDPSAWYHFVIAVDTTQSTAANRVKIYVNGTQIEDFSTETYPVQDYTGEVNNNNVHRIGADTTNLSNTLEGYLTEIHFVDGQALAATDFGEYDDNNVWQPKEYSGTYGTNGFRLTFADNSSDAALGTDTSGNSNTFTVNNLYAGAAVPNKGFDIITYTGNGSTQTIGGLRFQPDFVWVKNRSRAVNHHVVDSVRGAASSKVLYPNLNIAEGATNSFSAFTSDGFSVGSNSSVNHSGDNLVAWCFKAGGAASSNTDGSITSSVSANPEYGFSVVSFTGDGSGTDTIGHGLNAAPKLVIVKDRDNTNDWLVYTDQVDGSWDYLKLNTNDAKANSSYSAATSSVFSYGTDSTNYIAYCWSEVPGFSKFGAWTGNESSNGPTVTLGFKPRLVIFKRADSSGDNWTIFDTARDSGTLNVGLQANVNNAEESFGNRQIVVSDTGFQVTSTGASSNANGGKYLYAAFADGDSLGVDSVIDTPTNYTADSGNNGGNYCTLNPLDRQSTNGTLSNGNLDLTQSSAAWAMYRGTMFVSSGKWYYEVNIGNNQYTAFGILSDDYHMTSATNNWPTQTGSGDTYVLYPYTGKKLDGTQSINYTSANTSPAGDVYGVAFDLDNGTITFYKNGTSLGQAFTGISGNFAPAAWLYNQSNADSYNFGQRPFEYTPPTGHKSLCTQNLPDPTIADGSTAFDVITATGTGAERTFTMPGGFGPDLVWSKSRSSAYNHGLFDTVRGGTKRLRSNSTSAEDTSAQQVKSFTSSGFVQGTDVPNTSGETGVYWAWDAGANSSKTYTVKVVSDSGNKYRFDDFGTSAVTLDLEEGSTYVFDQSDSSNSGHPLRFSTTSDGTHGSGTEYTTGVTSTGTPGSAGAKTTIVVAASAPTLYYYCTNHSGMGGQANTNSTAGASNFDGSITTNVRASQTNGFSIATYTGNGSANQTLGHGLGAAPAFVIIKDRSSSQNWAVLHTSAGTLGTLDGGTNYKLLELNANAAARDASYNTIWHPTNTTVKIGEGSSSAHWTNKSGDNYVMYAWTPVSQYSAFGSYEGDNSTDGPFVYTGFRPRWVLIKNIDSSSQEWVILDAERNTFNVTGKVLYANTAGAEADLGAINDRHIDILSNGFKVNRGDPLNQSATHVFACFASHPFKTARAR